jgi:hypothetical protein
VRPYLGKTVRSFAIGLVHIRSNHQLEHFVKIARPFLYNGVQSFCLLDGQFGRVEGTVGLGGERKPPVLQSSIEHCYSRQEHALRALW